MIYAMFGMVVLTILVGVLVLFIRIKCVSSGEVKITYFRTMSGQEVPDIFVQSTRCFNNMFEVPLLFYVVITLIVALNMGSFLTVVLAWVFFGFRLTQAIIHLTYNNVFHRMLSFLGGIATVLTLWVVLLGSLA